MWLITYSQENSSGEAIGANEVTTKHPTKWLADCIAEFPRVPTVLLFAMEITAAQAKALDDVL